MMFSSTRFFPSQLLQSSPPTSILEPTSSSFLHVSNSRSPPTTSQQTLSPPFSIRSISQIQGLRNLQKEEESWTGVGGRGVMFPPLPHATDYLGTLGTVRRTEKNGGRRANSGGQRKESEGEERKENTRERGRQGQAISSQRTKGDGDLDYRSEAERGKINEKSGIAATTALAPTDNLIDSPSFPDLPLRSTTANLGQSPFPSSSHFGSHATAYSTASEREATPSRNRQQLRSCSKPDPYQQLQPISPTSTLRSPSPPPSLVKTSISSPTSPTKYSRSPEIYPLSPTSLDHDTSLTSPLPFPQFSNLPLTDDPRSLTPMPPNPSFDKPRPALFRTLPSGHYLPSRSMNRLRGVDEELDPEEMEWVEQTRRVRDDGRGRDWWGNPVGMGDWGRTILSPVWNDTEPTSSTGSTKMPHQHQLTSPNSLHRSKTSRRTAAPNSPATLDPRQSPALAKIDPSSLAQRIEYDQRQALRPNQDDLDALSTTASKKEPVSGIAPSITMIDRHDHGRWNDFNQPPSCEIDPIERDRKLEETRKWAQKTAEAYLEQPRSGEIAKEQDWRESECIGRSGEGDPESKENDVPIKQSVDTQFRPCQDPSTDPISTPLFDQTGSKAYSTVPSSRPFQESDRSTNEEVPRRHHDLDYMASLDYATAGDERPLSIQGGHSVPLSPALNDGIRRFDSSPDFISPTFPTSTFPIEPIHRLQRPTRNGPTPIPQLTRPQVAEQRSLRKLGVSQESDLLLEATKNGKRKEAWNEWSQFLERRKKLLAQLGPEPCYEDVPVLNALAKLHAESSNTATKETAEQFLLQSLQLDPSQPGTNSMLAKLLESKDPRYAIQFYQDALRLDPSNPTFHLRLASALELAASEQEAIEALDVMARTFPSTTWEIVARHRAGMLALAIGERRRAKESLGRALEGLQKRRERGSKERVDIPTMEELVDTEREVKEGLEELETNAGKEKLSPLELPQLRNLRPNTNGLNRLRRSFPLTGASSPPPATYPLVESLILSPLSSFELPPPTSAQDSSPRATVPLFFSTQSSQPKRHHSRMPREESVDIRHSIGGGWASPDFDFNRRNSLSPRTLRGSPEPLAASSPPKGSRHEVALAQTSSTLSDALRIFTMTAQDRTASQLALETRQVSEAMNIAFQSLRQSTGEELERNEELLQSLQELCKELDKLPERLIAGGKDVDKGSVPFHRSHARLDPIEAVKGKMGKTKKLLGTLFPSLS